MQTQRNPEDPNVKVPAAVKASAARAQAAFDAANGITPKDPVVPDPTPVEPPKDPPTDAKKVPAPAAPAPQPAPAAPPVTPQGNDWEHQYKSMKGRHDRSQQQIQTMAEQITSLQAMLASLQTTPAPPADPSAIPATRLVTPQDETDYGHDFLDVVGRKATEALSPEVAALKQEVSNLKNQLKGLGGTIIQDAKTRMIATLDSQIENWREINEDPNFFQWLQLPDAYSGAIRHSLLKDAWGKHDSPRLLSFFRGFLAEEAAVDPARREPDPTPAPAPRKTVTLESLAAPGRAKQSAAPGAPAEKPIITRDQIVKFYAAVTRGDYRGKEADKNADEAEIMAAQREGRIR
jgi:hypothetical protein